MGSNEPPRDYWIHQWKYTPTVHRDVYPAIDPKSPALSQKGKIVVISGASSGIGAEVSGGDKGERQLAPHPD